MSAIVNRRDLEFLLYECEQVERFFQAAPYAHLDRATVASMIDSAQAIAEEFYLPVAAKIDAQAPQFVAGGDVVVPPETGRALRAYADAGLFGQTFAQSAGGLIRGTKMWISGGSTISPRTSSTCCSPRSRAGRPV